MDEPRRDGSLAWQLRRAGSRQLLELVAARSRDMSLREVRQLLLNPFVNGEVIDELLAARHLLSSYEVRAAVARHPRTPEVAALRFLPGLYWRDLVEIGVDMRVRPTVRRSAEQYLVKRLPRLTVGERAAVARRGGPGILAQLRHDPSRAVVEAVLQNPRLTEESLIPLVASRRTAPRILDLVASDARWLCRYGVRNALGRNPRSPFRVLFAVLPTLRRRDLEAVAQLGEHSSMVRHRARRLLEERRGGGDRGFDPARSQQVEL